MGTGRQTTFDGQTTVLVKQRLLLGWLGYTDGFVLAFLERSAFEKGDFFLKDPGVTRDLNVLSHCIRKPQEIIGAPRPHAHAGTATLSYNGPVFHDLSRADSQKPCARYTSIKDSSLHWNLLEQLLVPVEDEMDLARLHLLISNHHKVASIRGEVVAGRDVVAFEQHPGYSG